MGGQVLRFLGMTVGVIQNYMKENERKSAYSCDVTYIANQELGFDYLRDNLATSNDQIVQYRPFNFCVVDEADSILIDEARTPLIISRKGLPATDKFITSASIAKNLNQNEHYEVDIKEQKIQITQKGYKYAEQILGKGLFDLKDSWAFFILNALKAKELYNEGSEYIIDNNEIRVIDSFSGRVLEGRRFSDGIQQSIEAKESLSISSETQTVAKITYQNLFRLFPKLSGMTGTAITESIEFMDVYNLKVLPVPTALPIARRDNPDAVFRTQTGKMIALLKNVITNHDKGRPILIGTTSVESSEEIAKALRDLDIKVNVLNAKPENVEFESETVAQAGRMNAVTVATNMAGRGTDILLGGSSKGLAKILAKWMILNSLGKFDVKDIEEKEESIIDIDINVIASNDNDNETKAELEIVSNNNDSNDEDDDEDDDEEEYIFTPEMEALPSINSIAIARELNLPVILSKRTEYKLKKAVLLCKEALLLSTTTTTKTTTTQGIQGEESSISVMDIEELIAKADDRIPTTEMTIKALRSSLKSITKEFEESMKLEREKVKRLGGLYVIGTSRHESRRIDNQLRGRAGRQCDPGASRFFLSLDDELFVTFGGDKMGDVLEKFRVAEDMPIENDLVMQALDKVQEKVEAYFAANRRQVFKLDEVMSEQRAAVYKDRQKFLTAKDHDMVEIFADYCAKTMEEICKTSVSESKQGVELNAEKLCGKALQFFPNLKLTPDELTTENVKQLTQSRLTEAIEEKRSIIDTAGSTGAFVTFFRYLLLVQTDESWCKHLNRLDLLKEEMVLQSFTAETDVLESYKDKAEKLYDSLMGNVRRNAVYSLFIYEPDASMASWAGGGASA